MGIYLPKGLPARNVLEREGVVLLDGQETLPFGIPPLRVALLNLMPQKPVTEAQFARLLGATPLPVRLTLVVPDTYRSKTTAASHIERYYRTWREIRDQDIDALIVTGAPVETLSFGHVYYWRELQQIFDRALHTVPRTLFVCWAAQAALYHRYGVPKHGLAEKAFGVFRHAVRQPNAAVMRGFGSGFWAPVSRHTEVRARDLPAGAGVEILAASAESGLCLLQGEKGRSLYMFNHLEYDTDTLKREHLRDLEAGKPIQIPRNYYRGDMPENPPVNRWRAGAHQLFANWLEEIHGARRSGIAAAA